jgi:hypothetical protein
MLSRPVASLNESRTSILGSPDVAVLRDAALAADVVE